MEKIQSHVSKHNISMKNTSIYRLKIWNHVSGLSVDEMQIFRKFGWPVRKVVECSIHGIMLVHKVQFSCVSSIHGIRLVQIYVIMGNDTSSQEHVATSSGLLPRLSKIMILGLKLKTTSVMSGFTYPYINKDFIARFPDFYTQTHTCAYAHRWHLSYMVLGIPWSFLQK